MRNRTVPRQRSSVPALDSSRSGSAGQLFRGTGKKKNPSSRKQYTANQRNRDVVTSLRRETSFSSAISRDIALSLSPGSRHLLETALCFLILYYCFIFSEHNITINFNNKESLIFTSVLFHNFVLNVIDVIELIFAHPRSSIFRHNTRGSSWHINGSFPFYAGGLMWQQTQKVIIWKYYITKHCFVLQNTIAG